MIDLADLKTALQIPAATTTHDAYLAALEARAVAYVERATGSYWGPAQSVSAVLVGDGTAVLWLPDPASAVASVAERAYEGGTETAITAAASNGWALRKAPGASHGAKLVRKGGEVWAYGYEYVVTYTRGYDPESEPEDVRQAVTGLVTLWFEQRLPVALGTVAPPVPDHVGAIIAARRRARA